MKNKGIAEVVALTIWLGVGSAFRTAEGRVWHVYPAPESALHSIQAGLNSCSRGDTVLVAKGTYRERLVWPYTLDVVLLSDSGPVYDTIDGGFAGSVITMEVVQYSTTLISGFTITHGQSSSGGGIMCVNCSPTIENNVITDNRATSAGAGLYCDHVSPTIRNNTFRGNAAPTGGGIYGASGSPTIVDNRFEENEGLIKGGAIYCNAVPGKLDSNRLVGNLAPVGAGVYGSGLSAHYNDLDGNDTFGVYNFWNDTADARFNWWGDSTGPYNPTSNPNGRGDWVSDRVLFDPWLRQPVIGIDESAVLAPPKVCDFAVYPNPAGQSLTISLPTEVRHSAVTICGASGRLIRVLRMEGKRHQIVSTGGLPPGVYFVNVTSNSRYQSKKVVISK